MNNSLSVIDDVDDHLLIAVDQLNGGPISWIVAHESIHLALSLAHVDPESVTIKDNRCYFNGDGQSPNVPYNSFDLLRTHIFDGDLGRALAFAKEFQQQFGAAASPLPPPCPLPSMLRIGDISGTLQGREFIFGDSYIANIFSILSAPGGTGKSTVALLELVSMAVGRDLLAVTRHGVECAPKTPLGPIPVLFMSLEDSLNEIRLRLRAIFIEYQFEPEHCELVDKNLRVICDDDGQLRIAIKSAKGVEVQTQVEDYLVGCIESRQARAVLIDPIVGFHSVGEGEDIQVVAEALRRIARRCGCAIKVVAHSRKGGFNDTDSTRGHSAFRDAARHQSLVYRPDRKTLVQMGVDAADLNNIIAVSQGKSNLGPKCKDDHFIVRALPVPVFLHGERSTQHVATVRPYTPPGIYSQFDSGQIEAIRAIPAILKPHTCRENPQADNWVGQLIADMLSRPIGTKENRTPDEVVNLDTIKRLVVDLTGKRGCWVIVRDQQNGRPVPFIQIEPEKLTDLTLAGIRAALAWASESQYAQWVNPEAHKLLTPARTSGDADE